jgi:hypothetical protein
VEIVANLLPDLVMRNQSVAALEKRKKDLVVIQLQEFKELVEDVRVAEEVGSVVGTVE